MRKFAAYAGLLCVGGVLVGASAFAGSSNPDETARANTTLFINATAMGRGKCQSLARSSAGTEVETCVSKLKDDADRRFKLLPSALGPSSDAMKYAKDYYAYWLTSLADVGLKDGEAQDAYASRQSASDARLAELQKKVEAELP